jgi:hypothetical protein
VVGPGGWWGWEGWEEEEEEEEEDDDDDDDIDDDIDDDMDDDDEVVRVVALREAVGDCGMSDRQNPGPRDRILAV